MSGVAGGYGQYLAAQTTAVKYGIPIKHVLLDNGSLGKIGKEQRAGQFPRWQVSLTNPNFADYAVLCGAAGETVRRGVELEAGVQRMFAATGPCLLHVVQDGELVRGARGNQIVPGLLSIASTRPAQPRLSGAAGRSRTVPPCPNRSVSCRRQGYRRPPRSSARDA